ncbi:hypothetical protein DL769_009956 [Monosporascus sp. CRB-8-3]|nr:hypothetical protein DL769_009956 [Monosporascus sp. CRB-8-3]
MDPSDEIDFTGLEDLRDVYHGRPLAYRGLLSLQTPTRYESERGSAYDADDMCGIDVLTCVVRHLYRHFPAVATGDRDCTDEEHSQFIADEEARNPLLRLAWSDLRTTRACVRAQNDVRTEIARRFLEVGGIASLSFKDLVESKLMVSTLFARNRSILFENVVLSQPIDADDDNWDAQETRTTPERWWELAKASLITWSGDGDLGDVVSDRFGAFDAPGVGRRYYWQGNRNAAVIRVLYTAPLEFPKRFADLRSFIMNAKTLRFTGSHMNRGEPAPPAEARVRYALIAVVRLRQGARERDLLRRYTDDGRHLVEDQSWRFARDDWRLGEPGRQYYLFYTPADEQSRSLPEVLPVYRGARNFIRDVGNWVAAAAGDGSAQQ